MQLEQKISLTEVKRYFKITKHAWETRKEEFLEYLKNFYEYSINTEGRSTYFIFTKQYAEYIPFPSKRDAEKIKAYYSIKTEEIVKEKPWNTGSCIARNIIDEEKNNIYKHKEDTAARYVRDILKEEGYIHPFGDSQWMRLAPNRLEYIPLTEDQKEYLSKLFYSYTQEGRSAQEMEKFAEYKSGYITEIELKQFLFNHINYSYESIMSQFKNEYGFRPQKVKYLDKHPIIPAEQFEEVME